MEYTKLINDVQTILYKSNLSIENRLKLLRNMVLYILGIEIELPGYKNKRKDSLVREQARECSTTEAKIENWLERAELSRYYLSYLRKGLCAYIQTGDLDYSSTLFKCYSEDLAFCYDILKHFDLLQVVKNELVEKPNPIFLPDQSIEYIMNNVKQTIEQCLRSMYFLIKNNVVEESDVRLKLTLWAHRVIYIKEGIIDMVYLTNIVKKAVTNKSVNVIDYYTSQKRNSGLVRTSDKETSNAVAEYKKITIALTEELSEFLVAKGNFKNKGVPDFVLNADLPERDKKKLSIFFSIINGEDSVEYKGFESWLKNNNKEGLLQSTKSTNEYIDKISSLAQEYLDMKELMPMLENAWEMYYNTKRVYDSSYKTKKNINKVKESLLRDGLKSIILINHLNYYPEEFIEFLKINNKTAVEVDCLSWSYAYYGRPTIEDFKQMEAVIKTFIS